MTREGGSGRLEGGNAGGCWVSLRFSVSSGGMRFHGFSWFCERFLIGSFPLNPTYGLHERLVGSAHQEAVSAVWGGSADEARKGGTWSRDLEGFVSERNGRGNLAPTAGERVVV